ncbi:MAG: lipoyl-dependent peroxiredoxin [Thermoleophilaceae bacterium]|nr:lipoyl-dependent peroxiredoxin [Thermoleophilaceae bacterium]
MKVLYTAVATADGGRAGGEVRSSDGNLELPVSPPKELGGEGAGTNPEQLFAAGYAACFHSAVMIVARRMDEDATGSTVTAHVDFGTIGNGRFGLGVELHVDLPNVSDPEARDAIVQKSHEVCPYSNATRGNIDVKLVVPAAA